jgi:hypothetical protein
MHRTGRYREMIWVGLVLLTIGIGLFITFTAYTSIAKLVGLQVVYGLGAGLLFETPIISIQNIVSQEDTATATATFGFPRNIATSVSLVLGGVVFQNGMDAQAPALRAAGLNSTIVEELSGAQAAASIEIIKTISDIAQRDAIKTAFARSFREAWIMYTVIAGLGLIAGGFIQQRSLREDHTETKTGMGNMSERT